MFRPQAQLAAPIAPTLIVKAIRRLTALLSKRSRPLSTRRLSCPDSVSPADVPVDVPVALVPFRVAVLATASVACTCALELDPAGFRPVVSAGTPGLVEEG